MTKGSQRFNSGKRVAGWIPLIMAVAAGFSITTTGQDTFNEWAENYLNRPEFEPASIGVHAELLKSGRVVYSRLGQKLLKPASCAKLFSGALLLDTMGPDYRISTPVYVSRPSQGGEVAALAVSGRGDISMGARFYDWDYSKGLSRIVESIQKSGIRKIRGPIIAEDLWFRNAQFGTGWTWDDLQYYYGAPVSSLVNDDNTVDLIITPGAAPGDPVKIAGQPEPLTLEFANRARTVGGGSRSSGIEVSRDLNSNIVVVSGSLAADSSPVSEAVSVPDPALWFGRRLDRALNQADIETSGQVIVKDSGRSIADEPEWRLLTSAESWTVAEMLPQMMKRSQNLHAQTYLLLAGRQRRDHDNFKSTEAAGIASLREFCVKAGIPHSQMLLDEGSGLSRSSLVSPMALTRLLTYMHKHRHAGVFIDSLPVGGVDGSLRYRLRGNETKGRVKAKTGSIKHVKCLSGFVERSDGETVVFSIMVNAYDEDNAPVPGKTIIDTLVSGLATRPLFPVSQTQ